MSEPAAPRVEPVLTCPICGSSQRRPFAVFEDRIYEVPGRYAYAQCRACETVFQDPRALNADLELLYPEAYITHGAVEEAVEGAPRAPLRRGLRERLRERLRGRVRASRAGHRCGPGRPAAGGLLAAREKFPLLACENVPLGEAGFLACARRGS